MRESGEHPQGPVGRRFQRQVRACVAGVADAIFAHKKSRFWYILESIGTEFLFPFGTFYCDYKFTAYWYILRPFGIFLPFWYFTP
jgi:hypothetical protein